ncbi:hypothetical protein AIIKEEIJ_00778 [Rhodococcus sp. YH1]|nr:hypothetical protein [Rhodococcus sp. YH1]
MTAGDQRGTVGGERERRDAAAVAGEGRPHLVDRSRRRVDRPQLRGPVPRRARQGAAVGRERHGPHPTGVRLHGRAGRPYRPGLGGVEQREDAVVAADREGPAVGGERDGMRHVAETGQRLAERRGGLVGQVPQPHRAIVARRGQHGAAGVERHGPHGRPVRGQDGAGKSPRPGFARVDEHHRPVVVRHGEQPAVRAEPHVVDDLRHEHLGGEQGDGPVAIRDVPDPHRPRRPTRREQGAVRAERNRCQILGLARHQRSERPRGGPVRQVPQANAAVVAGRGEGRAVRRDRHPVDGTAVAFEGQRQRHLLGRDEPRVRDLAVRLQLPRRERQLGRGRRVLLAHGVGERDDLLELGGTALGLRAVLAGPGQRPHHHRDDRGQHEGGDRAVADAGPPADLPPRFPEEVHRGRAQRGLDADGPRPPREVPGLVLGDEVHPAALVEQVRVPASLDPPGGVRLDLLAQRRVRAVRLDPGLQARPGVDHGVVQQLDAAGVDDEDASGDEVVDHPAPRVDVVSGDGEQPVQRTPDLHVGAGVGHIDQVHEHRASEAAATVVELLPRAFRAGGDRSAHPAGGTVAGHGQVAATPAFPQGVEQVGQQRQLRPADVVGGQHAEVVQDQLHQPRLEPQAEQPRRCGDHLHQIVAGQRLDRLAVPLQRPRQHGIRHGPVVEVRPQRGHHRDRGVAVAHGRGPLEERQERRAFGRVLAVGEQLLDLVDDDQQARAALTAGGGAQPRDGGGLVRVRDVGEFGYALDELRHGVPPRSQDHRPPAAVAAQFRDEAGLHERGLADAGGAGHHDDAVPVGGDDGLDELAHTPAPAEEQLRVALAVRLESPVGPHTGGRRRGGRLGRLRPGPPGWSPGEFPPPFPPLYRVEAGCRRLGVQGPGGADQDDQDRTDRLEGGGHPGAGSPVAEPLHRHGAIAAHGAGDGRRLGGDLLECGTPRRREQNPELVGEHLPRLSLGSLVRRFHLPHPPCSAPLESPDRPLRKNSSPALTWDDIASGTRTGWSPRIYPTELFPSGKTPRRAAPPHRPEPDEGWFRPRRREGSARPEPRDRVQARRPDRQRRSAHVGRGPDRGRRRVADRRALLGRAVATAGRAYRAGVLLPLSPSRYGSRARYSFVSRAMRPERTSRPTRLGSAISPFITSEKFHTTSSSVVAPT